MTADSLPPTSYTIAPGLIWRLLDENVVVVAPDAGDVHVLSQTGAVIWQLLAEEKSLTEIVTHLAENFTVSFEQAQADLLAFIHQLQASNLLQ